MLKQSECSKLAKAKFKQAAQGRAEPQGGYLRKRRRRLKVRSPSVTAELWDTLLLYVNDTVTAADAADAADIVDCWCC